MYYTTFPIQQQGIKGGWNFEFSPVYFIGLLNFQIDRFKERPEYLHHGKIIDIYTKEIMYDKLNMVYLEIPKLKKTKEELSSHLEWWIYLFQNLHQMSDIPKEIEDDIIKDAFDRTEFASMPKGEQENYHKNLKIYRDLVNSHEFAYQEGREEGEEIGIEIGIERGLEKGREEEKLEIAKNLKQAGVDIITISIVTGLSRERIEGV